MNLKYIFQEKYNFTEIFKAISAATSSNYFEHIP